jgi:DNA-binding NtrC family response regulator
LQFLNTRRKGVTLPRALLVAEDRYVMRLLARVVCDRCELTLARDSGEALARIASQSFELVLTALRGQASLDVLRAAKARLPDAEVIVLTEEEDPDAEEAAYELGAYQCLALFDPVGVVHAVEHAIERRTLRAEVERLRHELGVDADPHP